MVFERINASGLGLTIGSIGDGIVRNVTFRHCYLYNTVRLGLGQTRAQGEAWGLRLMARAMAGAMANPNPNQVKGIYMKFRRSGGLTGEASPNPNPSPLPLPLPLPRTLTLTLIRALLLRRGASATSCSRTSR